MKWPAGLGWTLACAAALMAALPPSTPHDRERLWREVELAQEPEKSDLARRFLSLHPEGPQAGQARYITAVSAFASGDLQTFIDQASQAAELLDSTQPSQRMQRLQTLSQLSFVLAESGRPQAAQARAQELLTMLSQGRPAHLSSDQWRQFKDRLMAGAHYSLGRAALGAAKTTDDVRASLQELRSALQSQPLDDYALYRLGGAYQQLGQNQKALQAFADAALTGGAASLPARSKAGKLWRDTPVGKSFEDYLGQRLANLQRRADEHPRAVFALPLGRPHPLLWWDAPPQSLRREAMDPQGFSNIQLDDYAGPDTCRDCHSTNYQGWLKHSHRRMNLPADATSVTGDFGGASIRYRGGQAKFFKHKERYRMRLRRDGVTRTYDITRTLGSRFYQYYVGRLIEGPEPADHPSRQADRVLPFGYWLGRKQWVPVVHIGPETPDALRDDPFAGPARVHYDRNCSPCHVTRPIGDWMLLTDGRLRLADNAPRALSFDMSAYLRQNHGRLAAPRLPSASVPIKEVSRLLEDFNELPAEGHIADYGITCEACHNGAKAHVQASTKTQSRRLPRFFPSSPYVLIPKGDAEEVWGRTSVNLNWTCSRCHSGGRPHFAGGMDTWNSTEYSDAARGFCYDADKARAASMRPLTCVTCHDPHFTIGQKWSRPPEQDDAACLDCHKQFRSRQERLVHTRHQAGSEGDRCLNCHMPRINEGLQDVVRTHRIFNPTNSRMIEANQPNACNLCHLDQPIDWTLKRLEEWYGRSYSRDAIASSYPERSAPVGLGWLKSDHEPTRLAAAAALMRSRSTWALPQLIEALDDPFLINRQIAQKGLEEMLGLDLSEFGYRFYLYPKERKGPLKKIRRRLAEDATAQGGPQR